MLNEWLLNFARWLDSFAWSTAIHESFYLYAWIESTHVLAIMIFLGMLFIIDLRILGLSFAQVPAAKIAQRLDKPMMIGFTVMVITGLLLFFARGSLWREWRRSSLSPPTPDTPSESRPSAHDERFSPSRTRRASTHRNSRREAEQ